MSARPPDPPTPEAIRERLAALRADRAFLLAHHGAMACSAPDLHAAYIGMYRALTLAERHLDPLEKESVWLAILVVAREAIGTHHLALFRESGGSVEAARALIAIAGAAESFDALAFAEREWTDFLPGLDAPAAYVDALARLRGDALSETTAELAMLAAQGARGAKAAVAVHLRRAYALGIDEDRMAEALTLLMWPCGVNRFLEACEVWRELMAAGGVEPSPRYRAWAESGDAARFEPAPGRERPGDFGEG